MTHTTTDFDSGNSKQTMNTQKFTCPRCTAALSTVLYEGVEIETCGICGGHWLDADELGQIVRTVEKSFTAEEIATLRVLRKNVFRIEDVGGGRLLCPKCLGKKLNPFNYASTSGITLDKCPQCRGIWLDKNELEMVQALVEDWSGYARNDFAKFGGVLDKTRSLATRRDPAAPAEMQPASVVSFWSYVQDQSGDKPS